MQVLLKLKWKKDSAPKPQVDLQQETKNVLENFKKYCEDNITKETTKFPWDDESRKLVYKAINIITKIVKLTNDAREKEGDSEKKILNKDDEIKKVYEKLKQCVDHTKKDLITTDDLVKIYSSYNSKKKTTTTSKIPALPLEKVPANTTHPKENDKVTITIDGP